MDKIQPSRIISKFQGNRVGKDQTQNNTDKKRASGILLHPTSLPGPLGIGDLGPEAYRFVDFLQETGQKLWQVLPLGPTGFGNSPYMSFSAFGGNPWLISMNRLADEGLLKSGEVGSAPEFPRERVDYNRVIDHKLDLLKRAFGRFSGNGQSCFYREHHEFCEANAFWLEDYALFMALKDAHGGRSWLEWEEGAGRRNPDVLERWRSRLSKAVGFYKFLQYVFFRQWTDLKHYCHRKGIRIIGDMPIYIALDSADVWSNRELCRVDETGRPTVVAGVPPDYFSATGQRWGNPVYRWDVMQADGYRWWIERFRMNFALVDIVRLDHFRGFEAYWEIPASEETAVNGRWVRAPGCEMFLTVRNALDRMGIRFDVIAEDLGVITPEVDALRDQLGLPGMRILQMAFGSDPKAAEYRPHNYIRNCVVYTATHDHNTTVGWYTAEPGTQTTQPAEEIKAERAYAREYAGSDGGRIHWDFIRLAMASVADTAVFPLQDVLGLGTESRMNRPGASTGNWQWRFLPEQLTRDIRNQLAGMTKTYER